MCRLGAIIGDLSAARPYLAAFRDAFAARNPHGYGIGGFVDGAPRVDRSPSPIALDPSFGQAPWLADARSAVMHVRFATAGATKLENTHPFQVGERILAHNGTFGNVGALDARLGADLARLGVRGDTDSERLAALLVRETERAGGDEVEGYRRAAAYLADEHPMTSITSISAQPSGDLVAMRYPENRTLFWKRLGARDAEAGYRLLAPAAAGGEPGLTVLASRPLDASAGWNELPPGQLLRIRADDLAEELHEVIDREPLVRFTDTHVDDGMPWTGTTRATYVDSGLKA